MNCPTCGAPITEETATCPSCNAPITNDETTRPVDPARRAEVAAWLDEFLRGGGLDPARHTDEEGTRFIPFGSVVLQVDLIENEGRLYLRALAPVIELPADRDLTVPLMRQLLELNLQLHGSERFGIAGTRVFCLGMRDAEAMQPEELSSLLFGVMQLADSVDDELTKVYGGTTKQRNP